MTAKEIAQYIINQFRTDFLGIPTEYQDILKTLLTLAAEMALKEKEVA